MKRVPAALLIAISLFFPILVGAEKFPIKSQPSQVSKGLDSSSLAYTFARGLYDYSDNGYILYVPAKSSLRSPASILVCLPGVGVRAKQDINSWLAIAAKNNFAVLDIDVNYSHIASIADVDALYERIMTIAGSLAQAHPVNKERLYIAGTSAGGMMAITLGLRYPENFIAIGVVSGAVLRFGAEKELINAKGLRIYMIHGIKDEIVPISMFYLTKDVLKKYGAVLKSKIYPEDKHPVGPSGYQLMGRWFRGLDR